MGAAVSVVSSPDQVTLDRDRELRAIVANARLRAFRMIAWLETQRSGEGWPDRWQHRDARIQWSRDDERGREVSKGIVEIEQVIEAAPRLSRCARA
jgi:hypothetical protein